MAAVFSALKRLVSDDRAVIFIHHHRKHQPGQGHGGRSAGVNIRGSSDILAAVDAHLAVQRKSRDLVVIRQNKLRIQQEMDPFKAAVILDENGKTRFSYQGKDESENEEMIEAQDKIKEVLEKAVEPLAVKTIAEETGVAESRVRKAIKELVNGKEAVESKAAHNKSLYALAIKEDVEANPLKTLLKEIDQEIALRKIDPMETEVEGLENESLQN